jgi:hypothetical protein
MESRCAVRLVQQGPNSARGKAPRRGVRYEPRNTLPHVWTRSYREAQGPGVHDSNGKHQRMKQRRLTPEQKLFIVTRLAAFQEPGVVRDALLRDYGFEVSLQSLTSYDPTSATGARDLSAKLKKIFEHTRAAFLKEIEAIPITHMAYRLQMLGKMERAAFARKNYPLVTQLLEQAAKETGGMYTNVRKHAGPHGEPLPPTGVVICIPDNGRDGMEVNDDTVRIRGGFDTRDLILRRAKRED